VNVVFQLIERVPTASLAAILAIESRSPWSERRGTRHARIHLNHQHRPSTIHRELHVRAAVSTPILRSTATEASRMR